jgi:hypothetical protein
MILEYNGDKFFIPTEEEVANLKVGDLAPSSLGADENGLGKVIKITYRGVDINGKPFVGFSTEWHGPGSSVTNSMKVDELVRTLHYCRRYTSAELDRIERELNARLAAMPTQSKGHVAADAGEVQR